MPAKNSKTKGAAARKPRAPRASTTITQVDVPENRREPIAPDIRAAIELMTPEELLQQSQDEANADAQARAAEARAFGGGERLAEDSHDPLDFRESVAAASQHVPEQLAPKGESFLQTSGHDRSEQLAAGDGFEQARPEMHFKTKPDDFSHRPNNDAQIPADVADPIAQVFGARLWNSGYSFDWCRDARGARHTFTYWFYQLNVIVDVFDANTFWRSPDAVRAEVAEKAATITRRNSVSPAPVGYIAFVRGYLTPQAEIDKVRAGFVCDTPRVPPRPTAGPPDQRDEVRAASGDPIADRNRGALDALVWNRPREAVSV
jgi:hypothetical protein